MAIVLIVAAVIVYPKLISQMEATPQNTGRVPNNQTATSAKQSQGEAELAAALKSGKPTMILFHSNACASCKEMTAVVVAVKAEHKDRVNFVDIDVSKMSEANIVYRFGISSIPTSIIFDKAGEQVDQYVGLIEKEQLAAYLTKLED